MKQVSAEKKYSLNIVAGVALALLGGCLDGVKELLLFTNAIPILGQILDIGGSMIISIIEVIFVFGGLWLAGAYRNTKGMFVNVVLTCSASIIDFVPIMNDLPVTTAAVIAIILKSRAADRIVWAENAAKRHAMKKQEENQTQRVQKGWAAAARAQAQRAEALEASQAALAAEAA